MPAPGFVPIISYHSTTASATPSSGNLNQGELAINVTDKKVYTKDGTNAVVKLVGSLGNQESNNVTITGGSITGVTGIGTGTVTSVDVSGGTTGLTTSGGPITSSGTITLTGTLAVANGGTSLATLTANNVILGNGTSAPNFVAPSTAFNVLASNGTTWVSTSGYARLAAVETFTAGQSGAYATLTSSSNSVAVNLSLGNNFYHALTENTTLAAPSNVVAGQAGVFEFVQNASAAKTLAFNTFWKFAGGAPTITTTLSATQRVFYVVSQDATYAACSFMDIVS
jgi:hypothetical protein